MKTYQVRLVFNQGISGKEYTFPHVFSLSDPKESDKFTIIEGKRGDGAIVIKGGKKSVDITVRGRLLAEGYEDLTTLITDLKTMITTDPSTLTLEHYTGTSWQTDWEYAVIRTSEIEFEESLRTNEQTYLIRFFIISY